MEFPRSNQLILVRQTRMVARAFTLLELMISMAVLLMIVFFVGQLMSSATTTIVNSGKLLDSDNQARLIFSQMANDFAKMYNRTDVNYYFHSTGTNSQQGENDEFYFYSEAPGYIASQDLSGTTEATINSASLIGYRVSDTISSGTRAELERLGRGLHWMDSAAQTGAGHATSVLCLPYLIKDNFSSAITDLYNNSSNPNPVPTTTLAPEWDVIGELVFRMEFCFLLKSGSFNNIPVSPVGSKDNLGASVPPGSGDGLTSGYSVGSRWYDTTAQLGYCCTSPTPGQAVWSPLGLQDVKAVVVTIATMDLKGRATTTAAAINSAIAPLTNFIGNDPSNPGPVPVPVADAWIKKSENVADFLSATNGLSKLAASSIRVYQRFFYLN